MSMVLALRHSLFDIALFDILGLWTKARLAYFVIVTTRSDIWNELYQQVILHLAARIFSFQPGPPVVFEGNSKRKRSNRLSDFIPIFPDDCLIKLWLFHLIPIKL